MLSDNIAVSVRDLTKCFHMYDHPRDRISQMLFPRINRIFRRDNKTYFREFWALKSVSFDIKRGETVGILGRNGAGKSTLLQLICGTSTPTSGVVKVNGRISALLELGAGFNPEFTGRENVFLYGAVLGLSNAEIVDKFSEIEEFAGIGKFIDQAVKTYSSGMFVRLAFAVSICVEPDIFIVDEALAVGDVKFQAKCFRRFETLVEQGTTIIFVTHSTEQIVRHCDWAILLDDGKIVQKGDPKDIENSYLDLLFGSEKKGEEGNDSIDISPAMVPDSIQIPLEKSASYNPAEYRWGDRQAEIVNAVLSCNGKLDVATLHSGQPFKVSIEVLFHKTVDLPIFGLTIKTPDGIIVFGSNSRDFPLGPIIKKCVYDERVNIDFIVHQQLGAGDFLLSLGVVEQVNGELIPLDRRYDVMHIHILCDQGSFGLVDMPVEIQIR